MIRVRKSRERGRAEYGWLSTRYSFSFARYHDKKHMGFRHLRVLNEDWIQAGKGFPMHPHNDMEILTYVLEGALEHKDSEGNGGVIHPETVQRMSAGTGIRHSEFNPSKKELVHLMQIWILPEKRNLKPGYTEKTIPHKDRRGKLKLLASRKGVDGSIKINQDVSLYASILKAKESVKHELAPKRHAWIQVASGRLDVNGKALVEGDGAAISNEKKLTIQAKEGSEFLLFDLA